MHMGGDTAVTATGPTVHEQPVLRQEPGRAGRMRGWLWPVALLLTTVAAGVLMTGSLGNAKGKVALGPAPVVAAGPRTDLPIAAIERTNRAQCVTVTGELVAEKESRVAAQVTGTAKDVMVERGSVVRTGDPLVILDPTRAANALREGEAVAEELRARLGLTTATATFDPENQPEVRGARSAHDLAKLNLERDSDLRRRNVIAISDLDQRQTAYDEARQRYELTRRMASQLHRSYQTALARLTTLRQDVEFLTIRAPFPGVVSEKFVTQGEAVLGAGIGSQPVATIVQIDPIRLVLTVPEKDVSLIRKDGEVEFQVPAVPGKTFRGRIANISPRLDTESRSLKVEALVANPGNELRPGYFATARLVQPSAQEYLAVPSSAVQREGERFAGFCQKWRRRPRTHCPCRRRGGRQNLGGERSCPFGPGHRRCVAGDRQADWQVVGRAEACRSLRAQAGLRLRDRSHPRALWHPRILHAQSGTVAEHRHARGHGHNDTPRCRPAGSRVGGHRQA